MYTKTRKIISRLAIKVRAVDFIGVAQGLVFGGLLVAGSFGLVQQVHAVQTIESYCSKYSGDIYFACVDGAQGNTDCNDYSIIIDDQTLAKKAVDACNQAVKDRGSLTTSSPVDSSTPSNSNNNSSGGSSSNSTDSSDTGDSKSPLEIQKDNQSNSLSDFIDQLHKPSPKQKDAKDEEGDPLYADTDKSGLPTNDLSFYINGGGKKQPIHPLVPGTGNSPVILFFNGGGWHANDCNGERIAKVGSEACPSPIYEESAENPASRGYAMIDVTYRLGSDGVYYMFEDVMRGIQHIHENAAGYGIDPNRIVIWGDSAGGSLVMRAAASGKSGAKAAVGWSAPTNSYTGLFHSFADLAIGIDHSTCIPTDIAGLANFADLANGGSGDVAEEGTGLSSNDFSALGIGGSSNPIAFFSQAYVAGNNLLSAAGNLEPITSQIIGTIKSGVSKSPSGKTTYDPKALLGLSSLSGSAFNIASKKFGECIDNFNALSPAMHASPDTPPSFLADFENAGIVGPGQAYAMRDKLRQLGIKSKAVILPGDQDCIQKSPDTFGTGCHLGYYPPFLCSTLNFIDEVVQPERGHPTCEVDSSDEGDGSTTAGGGTSGSSAGTSADNSKSSDSSSDKSSGSGSKSSGSKSSGTSGSNNSSQSSTSKAQEKCESNGGTWGKKLGIIPSCSYPADYQAQTQPANGTSCPSGWTYNNDGTCTRNNAFLPVSVTPASSGSTCPTGVKQITIAGKSYCIN